MGAAAGSLGRWCALALALASLPAPASAQALPPPIARALDASVWPRAPLLDAALASTGAELAWERHGTLGERATICVVDTGVDLRHRDLRDAEGATRVAWLVDLEGVPRGEEEDLEARHGAAIWSAAAIDAAIAAGDPLLPGDRHGHGTAIASIAAGDDAGSEALPGPSAGVAPGARLIVVRALRRGALGFEDRDVVTSVELCFALAGRGAEPTDAARTVALIALGNHDGAHDGTSELERALTEIAARGHAIVVAAGNAGGERAIHASGRGLPGAPARVVLHVPTPRDVAMPWIALAIRTASPLSIRAPTGERLEARDGERVVLEGTRGQIAIDRDPTELAHVAITGPADALLGGDYEIAIEHGPFDAWIVGSSLGAALGRPSLRGDHALEAETITIPATAPALISVAATATRDALAMLTVGSREDGSAAFSSAGPSPGSDARPDLAAPGALLSAALSGDLVPDDATNLIGGSRATLDRARVGEDRIAIGGSSGAAAVVAGAHALALSSVPRDPVRDRALLLATAEPSPGEAWTPTLGRGALRIDRWLAARVAEDRAGTVDPSASALSLTRHVVLPGASRVVAIARLLDAEGSPVHGGELAIRAGGVEVARAPIVHGTAEAAIELRLVAGERVEIQAGALAPRTVEARIDEGPRGAATIGGGGCTIASTGRRPSIAVVLWMATALSGWRRRARSRAGSRARSRPARRRRSSARPGW